MWHRDKRAAGAGLFPVACLLLFSHGVFFGLGGALGALSGGLVYERFGFVVLFRLAAGLGILGVVLFVLAARRHVGRVDDSQVNLAPPSDGAADS